MQAFVRHDETMPHEHVRVWAESHGLPAVTVDGNDVEAVHAAALAAAEQVRTTGTPYFLELVTYRLRGHFEADDQAYVDRDELVRWKARDPIAPMRARLLANGEIAHGELAHLERRDPRVLMFGEGVATKRGELLAEFGPARVCDTPLAEGIIAGTAAGAAAMGQRPVIDLLFAPFLTLSMDAIINSTGKLRYLSGGRFAFPMVVLTMTGAGWAVGSQHNHNLAARFVHAPGLEVVMPSSAADFKGLLKSAIRDDNPVMFFMDLALGYTPGEVPEGEHVVPLGRATVPRSGRDVTLVSYAKTLGSCLQAAEQLAAQGVDAEVAAIVGEKAFDALNAPIRRITGPDAPAASSWVLEQAGVPQADAVQRSALDLVVGEGVPA